MNCDSTVGGGAKDVLPRSSTLVASRNAAWRAPRRAPAVTAAPGLSAPISPMTLRTSASRTPSASARYDSTMRCRSAGTPARGCRRVGGGLAAERRARLGREHQRLAAARPRAVADVLLDLGGGAVVLRTGGAGEGDGEVD